MVLSTSGYSCRMVSPYAYAEKLKGKVIKMKTMNVQMNVPVGMSPYLNSDDAEIAFAMNAMMLYPLIKNLTISHGKAADILGVHKTDLIEFYGAMGIPYLDQSEEELLADVTNIDRLLGVGKR